VIGCQHVNGSPLESRPLVAGDICDLNGKPLEPPKAAAWLGQTIQA